MPDDSFSVPDEHYSFTIIRGTRGRVMLASRKSQNANHLIGATLDYETDFAMETGNGHFVSNFRFNSTVTRLSDTQYEVKNMGPPRTLAPSDTLTFTLTKK